jgi:hypothetical protein
MPQARTFARCGIQSNPLKANQSKGTVVAEIFANLLPLILCQFVSQFGAFS